LDKNGDSDSSAELDSNGEKTEKMPTVSWPTQEKKNGERKVLIEGKHNPLGKGLDVV
jgi:hypothetical protein